MEDTIRQYEDDAYIREFEAIVTGCEAVDGGYAVSLDTTAFFPESGGQAADTGWLNDTEVYDVQEKDGGIYHYTTAPLNAGSRVNGRLNWERRFSNMQQHSGEHIVSGLAHRLYGFENVGFHLGSQEVTLDFNGMLTKEQLEDLEARANQVVFENVPIKITYPLPAELELLAYRSKIALEGQVRIVSVTGYDVCACCAPHVLRTGEIGLIKIVNAIKYKGGMRLSILCGARALAHYRIYEANVHEISVMLSAKPEAVSEAVARVKQESESLRQEVMQLKNQLIELKLSQLSGQEKDILWFETGMDAATMRRAVTQMMMSCQGYCGVFSGDDADGYRYVLGSSTKDMKAVTAMMREQLNAKGGGSGPMIQGQAGADKAAIMQFFED